MAPIGEGAILRVGHSFWGTIDELSVYNVILTQQQIQRIVAAGPKGKCP